VNIVSYEIQEINILTSVFLESDRKLIWRQPELFANRIASRKTELICLKYGKQTFR
jgi:hypothetical protein